MLIAQIEPPHVTRGGDWYYRTHSPGLAMSEQDDVYVVDCTNTHRKRGILLDRADILVLNMVCDPDLLPVIAERTRRNLPTVYELNDDVACMQAWNPAAGFYANPEHQVLFRMLVKNSSGVQFCTAELEQRYGRLNGHSAVFRNQMLRNKLELGQGANGGTDHVVIGWGGSSGHLEDIAAIAPALVTWLAARDGVTLHLMCSEKIWGLFSKLPESKRVLRKPGSIDDYHEFVSGLDIGIAPLLDTGFNRCRSDVKFLEYALHGVAPVLQALAPYQGTVVHGKTGLLFRDDTQLISALEQLVEHPDARHDIGACAANYVGTERSERAHAQERIEFYRRLLGANVTQSAEDSRATFRELSQLDGAEVTGRHVSLNPTRYEQLLYNALVLGQMNGRANDAKRLLDEAARIDRDAYQPHLFGAHFAQHPIDALRTAISKNPKSIQARLLLAERFAQAGQTKAALGTLLAAAELSPSYFVPYQRLAQLLKRWNEPEEAERFFAMATNLRHPYQDSTGCDGSDHSH